MSGSTYDLSPLKLTDGSYAPSAFSDDRGALPARRALQRDPAHDPAQPSPPARRVA